MDDPDIRALCQAFVDAELGWQFSDCCEATEIEEMRSARDVAQIRLMEALAPAPDDRARGAHAILAALNAECAAAEARGYARAMGDLVERCKEEADDCAWVTSPCGVMSNITAWAQERAAMPEKEREG